MHRGQRRPARMLGVAAVVAAASLGLVAPASAGVTGPAFYVDGSLYRTVGTPTDLSGTGAPAHAWMSSTTSAEHSPTLPRRRRGTPTTTAAGGRCMRWCSPAAMRLRSPTAISTATACSTPPRRCRPRWQRAARWTEASSSSSNARRSRCRGRDVRLRRRGRPPRSVFKTSSRSRCPATLGNRGTGRGPRPELRSRAPRRGTSGVTARLEPGCAHRGSVIDPQ
jgi:hypothetical protein